MIYKYVLMLAFVASWDAAIASKLKCSVPINSYTCAIIYVLMGSQVNQKVSTLLLTQKYIYALFC